MLTIFLRNVANVRQRTSIRLGNEAGIISRNLHITSQKRCNQLPHLSPYDVSTKNENYQEQQLANDLFT